MSIKAAKAHLSKDKILKGVIQTTEILKLPNSGHVFNELVKAIVYQQISYKAADSIYARFVDLLKTEDYLPKYILKFKPDDLRAVGFSRQKAQYVLNIAEFFEAENLMSVDWNAMSDEDILGLLTQIKGVGEWTVQMILIFELGRPDVLPVKDLAIQLVAKELYQLKSEKTKLLREIEAIGEAWRPFRTYASLYLWAWRRDNY
ncbi:MAG: DNA-3-methyladenine glycosylase 2 family protein [Saprospiraceae bacterium]|nr:DNA-3-methyladenine glycosylase 2 family protein [Saprospiraceae bacterium]